MSEYIVGKSVDRPPRKVKLALVGEYLLVYHVYVCLKFIIDTSMYLIQNLHS